MQAERVNHMFPNSVDKETPNLTLGDAKLHEMPTYVMKWHPPSGQSVGHVHRSGQVQSGQQSSLSPETQF